MNVDAEASEAPDVVLDLTAGRWPWEDSSVDEVCASHILEHIAPGAPFFHVVQEIHRICKPGAGVTVVLPHPSHDVFLNDPTHVQALMPGTFALFSKRYIETMAARGAVLTPFYARLGVDFDINTVGYVFDARVDKADPELEWKAEHLRNIILEWNMVLVVVK